MKYAIFILFFLQMFPIYGQDSVHVLKPVEVVHQHIGSPAPVPAEIFSVEMLSRNGSGDLAGMLNRVPGMRVNLACGVCHTSEIRLRGTEGRHSLLSINGIPVFGALASVYGWMGIPSGMIAHVEITSGPQRVMFGPGGMGGMVDVQAASPDLSRPFGLQWTIDANGKQMLELNWSCKSIAGFEQRSGIYTENVIFSKDLQDDGYHDYPHMFRIGLFSNWLKQKDDMQLQIFLRAFAEERWGGQWGYSRNNRGSEKLYGEWAQTLRGEWLMKWEQKKWHSSLGLSFHYQDSWYGTTAFRAIQPVMFGHMHREIQIGEKSRLRPGISIQLSSYDDSSPATISGLKTSFLGGIYTEYDLKCNEKWRILPGGRIDYDNIHGLIPTPRLHLQFQPHPFHGFRLGAGSAFRVVNLFTEDHAALSGFREVIIPEVLKPERSWSAVLRYQGYIFLKYGQWSCTVEGFFHRFSNRILPDYDSSPDQIIYRNDESGVLNTGVLAGLTFKNERWDAGGSMQYVYARRDKHTANGTIYHTPAWQWDAQFGLQMLKGKLRAEWNIKSTGPMRLPIQEGDTRPSYSPWYSLHDLLFNWTILPDWKLDFGVRNLFDYIPLSPITRGHDPFDQLADDPVDNPYHQTFDASYTYAPMQGITPFVRIRYQPLKR